MKADKECLNCCRNKVLGLLEQYQAPDKVRTVILEHTEQLLQEAGDKSAPVLMAELISKVENYLNVSDSYESAKKNYNQILMAQEEKIRQEIAEAEDSFLAGIQYAITGNYIDFGAMSDVNEKKLDELLRNRSQIHLSEKESEHLRNDLANAESLVYITDNTGEIVLDKIFLEVLKKLYPNIKISVIVRGTPILNDATYIDAEAVGITEIAQVIPNGTNVPGTPLDQIAKTALYSIENADLCIAKGQGNFETLRGCGKNIYYLFLCKCELFVRKFKVRRFAPMLSNETRIVQYV